MNKEIRNKWIKDLRSGEYKQYASRLCNDGQYCCLGVLCESMNLPSVNYGIIKNFLYKNEEMTTALSSKLLLDLEMPGGACGRLMTMNDHDGYSFKQIADWIEENL